MTTAEIPAGQHFDRSGDQGGLGPLGYKIFLDRYALKDMTKRSIAPGDTVVVVVDQKTGQREIGTVTARNDSTVVVELREGGSIQQAIEHVDKPLETHPAQMVERVARGIAEIEAKPEKQSEWQGKFEWLLSDWRFIPGGRILAAAGTDQNLTFYNCYVIPSPKDSRTGIVETLSNMMEIMSRGGGVGINVSSLRPKHAYVKGVNGRSSGAVSWGGLYSFVTGLIEQGGSRRGALMLILNDWHPDLPDFINAKREAGKITNANISVGVSDAFMKAVEEDDDWQLVFPDTADPDYDTLWDGDLAAWKAKGKPVVVHKTLKAREVWNQITESAWASAEPGCFFIDRYNAMSNSWYYAPIFCTNPCGEQGLPAWGVCNLGAIHLAKFVTPEREVLWQDLGRAVRYGIRFLDNVIDATPYFFDENAAQQQGERRVGLGTMGLGEMLIRLGIRYGSAESEQFIDKLYEFIAGEAYLASAEYAAEKGAFPQFDAEKVLQSGYMQSMPERVRAAVRQQGLRNVTLLTQAPTGTTGTMMDTSTGIEPYFSWSYFRKGRLGVHEVSVPVVAEWKEQHPDEELPEYFVAAMDLTPEEHVRVEAAIQRWVDSSISKTANLPADYTVEQTRELYELMYRLGCKGGTVYRDSSRDEQVLMLKPQSIEAASDATALALNGATSEGVPALNVTVSVTAEAIDGEVADRPKPRRVSLSDERQSITHKFQVGEQEGYITVGLYADGAPGEVFLRVNKQGSTVSGLMESLGLLTSIALQYGVPLEGLARKMKNSRFEPYGMTGNREIPTSTSLVDYVFRWLEKKFVLGEQLSLLPGIGVSTSGHEQLSMALQASQTEAVTQDKANVEYVPSGMGCPECGSLLHHAEGCLICRSCGYTKCG
ncbi:MAG: adenosylcobalamin-dependent ribonucleoside-diphosphate reductase [Dehalococcoidia bacterium]